MKNIPLSSGLLSMKVSLEWLFNILGTQELGKILSSINLLTGCGEGVSTWNLTSIDLTLNVPGRLEALYHLQGSWKQNCPKSPFHVFLPSESYWFWTSCKICISSNIFCFGYREIHSYKQEVFYLQFAIQNLTIFHVLIALTFKS